MPAWDMKDKAAVSGVGHSPYGKRLNRSTIDLAGEAIRNALDDAGLTRDDLDGLIVSFGTPIGADADTLAYALGLKLRMYNQTWAHGRFTATCIQNAAMAVSAGLANHVACLASISFSGFRKPMMGGAGDNEGAREGGGGHGEDPVYGMTSPGAGAALVAQKYFARYGATSRQLASVAVAFRKHASLNPGSDHARADHGGRSPEFALCLRATPSLRLLPDQRRRSLCDCTQVVIVLVTSRRDRSTSAACKGYLPDAKSSFGHIQDLAPRNKRYLTTSRVFSQSIEMAGVTQKDMMRCLPMMLLRFSYGLRWNAGDTASREKRPHLRKTDALNWAALCQSTPTVGLISEAHIMGWNHQVEISAAVTW